VRHVAGLPFVRRLLSGHRSPRKLTAEDPVAREPRPCRASSLAYAMNALVLMATLAAACTGCSAQSGQGAHNVSPAGRPKSSIPYISGVTPATVAPMPISQLCPSSGNGSKPSTLYLTTPDRVRLYAAVFGSGTKGVVMANDVPHPICDEIPEARLLAEKGFRVIVFDYRDRGQSGSGGSHPGRLDLDVVAAAEKLRHLGAGCVVLAGSYGGVAASILAALDLHPAPAALIGFSPAVYRYQYIQGPFGPESALAAAPRLRLPTLYVTERGDSFLRVGEARRLLDVTGSRDKRLLVVSPWLAGWSLLDSGPSSSTVERAAISLMRSSCR
jgi:pimeloyl-ACP methyl ester carboxylesterase